MLSHIPPFLTQQFHIRDASFHRVNKSGKTGTKGFTVKLVKQAPKFRLASCFSSKSGPVASGGLTLDMIRPLTKGVQQEVSVNLVGENGSEPCATVIFQVMVFSATNTNIALFERAVNEYNGRGEKAPEATPEKKPDKHVSAADRGQLATKSKTPAAAPAGNKWEDPATILSKGVLLHQVKLLQAILAKGGPNSAAFQQRLDLINHRLAVIDAVLKSGKQSTDEYRQVLKVQKERYMKVAAALAGGDPKKAAKAKLWAQITRKEYESITDDPLPTPAVPTATPQPTPAPAQPAPKPVTPKQAAPAQPAFVVPADWDDIVSINVFNILEHLMAQMEKAMRGPNASIAAQHMRVIKMRKQQIEQLTENGTLTAENYADIIADEYAKYYKVAAALAGGDPKKAAKAKLWAQITRKEYESITDDPLPTPAVPTATPQPTPAPAQPTQAQPRARQSAPILSKATPTLARRVVSKPKVAPTLDTQAVDDGLGDLDLDAQLSAIMADAPLAKSPAKKDNGKKKDKKTKKEKKGKKGKDATLPGMDLSAFGLGAAAGDVPIDDASLDAQLNQFLSQNGMSLEQLDGSDEEVDDAALDAFM